jgi:hypothetical protein
VSPLGVPRSLRFLQGAGVKISPLANYGTSGVPPTLRKKREEWGTPVIAVEIKT